MTQLILSALSSQYGKKMSTLLSHFTDILQRDFSPELFSQIPPHGRWQHFDTGSVPRLERLLMEWRSAGIDEIECSRRMIDLFLVSVLLDAGAGDVWRFTEKSTGNVIERSEGLAVASMYAFTDRLFSSDDSRAEVNGMLTALLVADLMLTRYRSCRTEVTYSRKTR
jgi:hypothetical protein